MNDIIRELRLAEDYPHDITIFDRAANEVKRLRGENERLASSGGKYMAIAEKRYAMYEAAVKRAEKAEIELAESRRIQNASYMDGVKKAIYEIMKEADIPGSQEIRESGDTDDGMCAQAAERIKTIVDDSQRRAQAAEDAIKKSCENCSFNTEPCDSTDCEFYKFKELRGEKDRPEIVCLCGSARFFRAFDEQNCRLTLEGKIVLTIFCRAKSVERLSLSSDDKVRLKELHKRKIDLADRVLVLNVGGYIGDDTRSEIEYAKAHGKPVEYLEGSN